MVEPTINAIIVDNDVKSANILKGFIDQTSNMELVGSFRDISNALQLSNEIKPEIIYVDMDMSGLQEYEYLSSVSRCCKHLIITSYEAKYAIEGYHNNVSDYLMKPLSYDKFSRSLHKLVGRSNLPAKASFEEDYVWIKSGKKVYRMWKPEIELVEALKDYVIIHYKGKKYITHLSMANIEEYLGSKYFIRVNRSCIISIDSIISIYGNVIETTFNKEVPVGVRYKDRVRLLYPGF